MAIETLKMRFTGIRPFLMHNVRLADPLDPATKALKEVTSKKTKTEEDHEEMARLEFIGGLYLSPKGHPVVRADMVRACLVEGGRKAKAGKKIEQGCWIDDPEFVLKYSGPKDAMGLYNNEEFRLRCAVGVSQKKIMRTRPRFPTGWSVDVAVSLDTSVVERKEVIAAASVAGSYVGLGDYRPQYGRFTVDEVKK